MVTITFYLFAKEGFSITYLVTMDKVYRRVESPERRIKRGYIYIFYFQTSFSRNISIAMNYDMSNGNETDMSITRQKAQT